MQILTGQTIVITGGNRGIGQAMALRFAKAGANIVILSHDDSEDINTTVDQVIQAGGKAFAITVDVRDEAAVKLAIKEAAAKFGGIDALVNNVSAFCFSDTVEIAPEKFDLLFSVNVRATFLLSQTCIPYLKKSANPHIINIAPPLDMDAKWFKNHLAFTMSKYGMSMCTLGMAGEFKKAGIAVNSLWPQTTIATATIKEYFLPEVYAGSRWPAIMADAAYELIQRNAKACTGHFFIDEALLRENGITDFTQYAVDANAPLVQDLFVTSESLNAKGAGIHLDKNLFV